jgi:hypothetical protein
LTAIKIYFVGSIILLDTVKKSFCSLSVIIIELLISLAGLWSIQGNPPETLNFARRGKIPDWYQIFCWISGEDPAYPAGNNRNEQQIGLYFEYAPHLIENVKSTGCGLSVYPGSLRS